MGLQDKPRPYRWPWGPLRLTIASPLERDCFALFPRQTDRAASVQAFPGLPDLSPQPGFTCVSLSAHSFRLAQPSSLLLARVLEACVSSRHTCQLLGTLLRLPPEDICLDSSLARRRVSQRWGEYFLPVSPRLASGPPMGRTPFFFYVVSEDAWACL